MRRLLILALIALPLKANAGFHAMKITEIYAGSGAAPNSQFVELEMTLANQTVVSGHEIFVFNASDVEVGQFVFSSNVSNGTLGDKILIATTEAVTEFGVASDLTMTAAILTAGGKVCFETAIDCVAWGSFSGTGLVGTPFNAGGGLTLGMSIARSGTTDTNNSAADFSLVSPTPTNNAGVTGAICGNGQINSPEECDDGASNGNTRPCLADCTDAACDDGFVCSNASCTSGPASGPEECDNGGSNDNNAACKADCSDNVCGDGYIGPGEACDGDDAGTGGVTATCSVTCTLLTCGNGTVDAGEDCDDQNSVQTDSCLNNCLDASCGDTFVQSGVEECDDGNTTNGDGCDDACEDEPDDEPKKKSKSDDDGGCVLVSSSMFSTGMLLFAMLILRRRRRQR